jgi:GNAT superfamily N-acetyltransferase
VIRAAAPGDVASLARVHVRSWQRAYGDLIEARKLAEIPVERREHDWEGVLAEEGHAVWVYEAGGRIAGFASVRGDELVTIYVDPPAQGAGVGTALLQEAVAAGARHLTVFDDNGLARAFYERHGWWDAGPGEPCHGLPSRIYRCGER